MVAIKQNILLISEIMLVKKKTKINLPKVQTYLRQFGYPFQWRIQRGAEGTFALPNKKKERER
jgi:hypothetical protein